MKEELAAGLKNAVERGYSLEEAVNSFIAAGYNPETVKDAAEMITSGATTMLSSQPIAKGPSVPLRSASNQASSSSQRPIAPMQNPSMQKPQPSMASSQVPVLMSHPDTVKGSQPMQQAQSPLQRPSNPPSFQSQPTLFQNNYSSQKPQEKEKSKTFIIVFLVVWLLLLAGALLAIWIFKDRLLELLS